MLLAFPSPPSLSPPSPVISDAPVSAVSGDGHSGGATIIIIVSIIAFIIAASACIRLISRFRSSSSSNLLRPIPAAGNAADPPAAASDRDKLISSLPLFNLGSSASAFEKSQSLDCAVCLSNFRPHDELRLLPACHHAFHSQCVDTWLRSTPSCPLCRASIELPPPSDLSRSGSFRVEIGSVSRRRPSVDGVPAGHGRSYSLGSSLEYLVEEDVEAVLECLRGPPEGKPPVNGDRLPTTEVTEAAGGRGWLRDCVDRLATSASSSFNSLRFSGRIAGHLFDPPPAIAADSCRDLEASGFVEWEDTGLGALYRWLVGV